MRFLGVTETCDLGALYLRLLEEGHEVKVFVQEPKAQGTLAGMAPRTEDWREELGWISQVGEDGVVLFEAVSEGLGELQDELRRQGYNVVGGSAFGDRLENDRAFAFDLMKRLGMQVAGVREFDDADEADAYIDSNPGRYVLKFSGPDFASSDNYVGQIPDGSDVRAYMRAKASANGRVRFVLMDFVEGIEMGVGAYFNGEHFLGPACLDWEHKRFFPGDLGELTGEMGTVATYSRSQRFFERTLKLAEPSLREAGHVGYVNLNTIVNEDGIWPLEFTCRFGYPGFAVLEPLHAVGWGEIFQSMVSRQGRTFPTKDGFSVGVVLTTPPFPYSRKQVDEAVGLPVTFHSSLSPEDRRHVHYGEIGKLDGQLVTSGLYGWTMVVTGTSEDIAGAKRQAYSRCQKISVPNLRFRLDIGDKLIATDWSRLRRLGLLS